LSARSASMGYLSLPNFLIAIPVAIWRQLCTLMRMPSTALVSDARILLIWFSVQTSAPWLHSYSETSSGMLTSSLSQMRKGWTKTR